MLCPKCEKDMVVMAEICRYIKHEERTIVSEVIGRCDVCDFDATWKYEVAIDNPSHTTEYDLMRYFFG